MPSRRIDRQMLPSVAAATRSFFRGARSISMPPNCRSADVPVIVDFWASWCEPCPAMAPIFAQAAQSLEPRARFVKVNVDENPQAAREYGVQGIPALFAFRGGKVAATHSGVTDSVALRDWVQQLEA